MKITKKLISYLYRAINPDPVSFLALRLRYNGNMTWSVSDAVLSTSVTGGLGSSLSIKLVDFTLASLVNHLAAQDGYTVEYADMGELSNLSARVLLDASGDQDTSNGDHIYGYTSTLWAYLEPLSVELNAADYQVGQALRQMNMLQAETYWLDEWGSYYGVPRQLNELDDAYANRIIIEVLRPRGNNVALELIASDILGSQVRVTDVREWGSPVPAYNSGYSHDGVAYHNATASPRYGLFDVEYAYNLESGVDIYDFSTQVASVIDYNRDAGTHMRALSLLSSGLFDSVDFTGTDGLSITISYGNFYNAAVNHNGAITYAGAVNVDEVLS